MRLKFGKDLLLIILFSCIPEVIYPSTDYSGREWSSEYLQEKRHELAEILGLKDMLWIRKRVEDLLSNNHPMSHRYIAPRFEMVGKIDGEGFYIEKVRVETAPSFYALTNIYYPDYKKPPFPLILSPHGHWGQGKSAGEEQGKARRLAMEGFVVAIIDSPGIEESFIPNLYSHFDLGLKNGAYLFSSGITIKGIEVMNLIRVLDYLTGDERVDLMRIGSSGASSGASQLLYHSAIDTRVKVIVPASYELIADSGGGDACICEIIPEIEKRFTPVELRLLPYPARALFLSNTNDEHIAPVIDFYEKNHKGDFIRYINLDGVHGFTGPMLRETVLWFRKWFGGDDRIEADKTGARDLPEDILKVGLPDSFSGIPDLARSAHGGESLSDETSLMGNAIPSILIRDLIPLGEERPIHLVEVPSERRYRKSSFSILKRLTSSSIEPAVTFKVYKVSNIDRKGEELEVGRLLIPTPPYHFCPLFILISPPCYTTFEDSYGSDFEMVKGPLPLESEGIVRELLDAGYTVFIPDQIFPGDGVREAALFKSSVHHGLPITYSIVSELEVILHQLIGLEFIDPDFIGVWGEGGGGILALLLSSVLEADSVIVITDSPLSYLSPGIPDLPLISFPTAILKNMDIPDMICSLQSDGKRFVISSPVGLAMRPLYLYSPSWRRGGNIECYEDGREGGDVSKIPVYEGLQIEGIVDKILETKKLF